MAKMSPRVHPCRVMLVPLSHYYSVMRNAASGRFTCSLLGMLVFFDVSGWRLDLLLKADLGSSQ